ncbi:MAG: leucine-rich repeat domain-containing protein, partial [Muribaculaceae bacterium]|nr:leucine-rich repeat domain-containing protein [Muribaculaceae bacterium]
MAEVKLPNSLLKIGGFDGTIALKEITFPDALKEIGSGAFSDSGLSSINFGSGLKTIGRGAFLECRNVKSLTLPEGLETIGGYAFAGHNGYSYLYLPSTLISVGERAFEHHSQSNDNYESLAGSIEILEVPTLELFTSIDWDNYSDIGTNPLIYTEDLRIDGKSVTELVIPDNVTEINEWWALTGWKNLKSIVIPSTIKSLIYHWGYPNKIEKITIEDSNQPLQLNIRKYPTMDAYWTHIVASYNLNIDNIYIGRNFTSDTQQMMGVDGLFEGSTVKEVMFGNDKTELLPNSFKDCKELTKISFGHSITAIGESAFEGCSALNEVVFPPMLETIGAKAFNGCPDLKYIAMGYNVKSIGEQAFGASTPEQVLITAIT